jgi:putative DNA primase/helicase
MQHAIDQLMAAGLEIDGAPEIGRLVRCRANGEKGNKKSGWYVVHEFRLDSGDVVYVGAYGNWKVYGPESLKLTFDKPVSDAERDRIAREQDRVRKQAAKEKLARQAEAAERSQAIWDALPDSGASEYLDRKKVRAWGVKFSRGSIVVPVRNADGALVGLQFIAADGSKKFITGTAKQGAFHLIGEVGTVAPLAVAEGYATAASIHQATSWPVAVAFDAGNLAPVCKALQAQYPKTRIVVCADDDRATEGNPGVASAQAAADAVGGVWVKPEVVA